MTNPYENVDAAARAIYHAESIELPRLATPDLKIMTAGVRAITYALLDLAQAIREHKAG